MSLTLNQTLDMIKLSEEGMLKAKTGLKGLDFGLTAGQIVNAKEMCLKKIKIAAAYKSERALLMIWGKLWSGQKIRSATTLP